MQYAINSAPNIYADLLAPASLVVFQTTGDEDPLLNDDYVRQMIVNMKNNGMLVLFYAQATYEPYIVQQMGKVNYSSILKFCMTERKRSDGTNYLSHVIMFVHESQMSTLKDSMGAWSSTYIDAFDAIARIHDTGHHDEQLESKVESFVNVSTSSRSLIIIPRFHSLIRPIIEHAALLNRNVMVQDDNSLDVSYLSMELERFCRSQRSLRPCRVYEI